MALSRFRQFRGKRTQSKAYDGDTFDGTGEALRQSQPSQDEGDARMRELMRKLDDILGRPDAKAD